MNLQWRNSVSRPLCGCGHPGSWPNTSSLLGWQASDVAHPDLVGARGRGHFGQPVFGDGQVVVALRGAGPKPVFLPCPQAGLAHQSGHAVFAARMSLPPERHLQSRTAITFTAGRKGLTDQRRERLILLGTRSFRLVVLGGVITGAGNIQRPTEQFDGF